VEIGNNKDYLEGRNTKKRNVDDNEKAASVIVV
jgi:hypothetical protein